MKFVSELEVMLAVVVLILCSVAIACAVLVNGPSNVVALKGTRVELTCEATKTSCKFHWTFTPIGESEVTVYTEVVGVNEKYAGRITVIEMERSRNLVIDSVKLEDAGTYMCKVISANGNYNVAKESGQLIVLDGEPECGTNLTSLYNSVTEGDYFQLFCNISYRGNWMPKMDCSQDGGNRTISSEDISLNSSIAGQQSVMHIVTYAADRSKHDTLYSCRIFFSREHHRVVGFAYNNVSYYARNWTSPRVNITYAPRQLSILPVKQIYNPGDRLTCSSDANPSPSIEWKELNTGRSVSEGPFPIKEYMTQEPISSLECSARNSFGSTSRKISFSVEKVSTEPSSSSLTSITVTIGGILSVFFIAMLVMLIVYHMHIKRIVAGRKRASNENSVITAPSVENYEDIPEHEGREQPDPDDITWGNHNDLSNNDINETHVPETRYDELTPRDQSERPTYFNLSINRSPSAQIDGSLHRNSIDSEAEEFDFGENSGKHNYYNITTAIDQT